MARIWDDIQKDRHPVGSQCQTRLIRIALTKEKRKKNKYENVCISHNRCYEHSKNLLRTLDRAILVQTFGFNKFGLSSDLRSKVCLNQLC